MNVELLRAGTLSKSDHDFQVTLIMSLLGLTVTLFALPLFGGEYGALMALAG